MRQEQLLGRIYWISGTLILIVAVFLASVLFLNPSSVGNPRFISNINLWATAWGFLFIFVLALSFFLARYLIKLFFEYQGNRPGSRIQTKLVLTLLIFSLFPALIMAFLAFGLINQNLRQWFSSPSEQLLSSSQVVSRQYYEQTRAFRLAAARGLAAEVPGALPGPEERFTARLREFNFQGAALLDRDGSLVWQSGEWAGGGPPDSAVRRVLEGEEHYQLDRVVAVDQGLTGIPIPSDGSDGVSRALFLRFRIPESVLFHTIQVQEASDRYSEMKASVSRLELNYFSILGLTTMAVVLGFIWLGTYIARKITVPLEALAEASGQLAAGNLDHRVDVAAVNELGILVDSFNRMAQEIKQSRRSLEVANQDLQETNVRLEERRKFIETILQNIGTGVISIDSSDTVRAANEAALKMFRGNRDTVLNQPLAEILDPELHTEIQNIKKRALLFGTYRQEVTFRQGERDLHVATTITSNPSPDLEEFSYLIVFDDLTELLAAEKFAAWQEVARRLAHEIKNPLTPIQLSAERVKKRFDRMAATFSPEQIEDFRRILHDSMRIIADEAEILRKLVEEFSRFARLPICKPERVPLHRLIEGTLMLYDGGLEKVLIQKDFDPRIREMWLDPGQIQRAFVNLIDNSLDALAESESAPVILIRTRFNDRRQSVTIEIQDNGSGIEPLDYENLFLPYFSTKKKGTGLGLVIVRQIISEHHGFVRAEPSEPHGTRVIMELPVGPREAMAEIRLSEASY